MLAGQSWEALFIQKKAGISDGNEDWSKRRGMKFGSLKWSII